MYFPLSQIETNLYTPGNEFILISTGEEYIGNYFRTSKGQFYTGKNPQDKPNNLLSPSSAIEGSVTNNTYYELEPANFSLEYNLAPEEYTTVIGGDVPFRSSPQNTIPLPQKNDYENQNFQRYFLKKNTNYMYSEIDKNQFSLYSKQDPTVQFTVYTPLQLNWKLKGKLIEVYKQNYNTVKYKANLNGWAKFEEYFKWRFAKYYKGNKDDINYTEGGELKTLDTNQEYVGYYHVHPQRGVIMEGRFHQPTPHSILIPIIEGEVLSKRKKLGATDEVGTSRRRNIPRGGY